MNDTVQKYPRGIEFRTPRPRGTIGGALVGALFGYALTQNSGGTLAGTAIGGAIGNQPLPLNQAIRQVFSERGLNVISFYRLGRSAAKILFLYQGIYWTLESHAPQNPRMTDEQVEDWLFGDLIQKLDDFLNQKDLRLQP